MKENAMLPHGNKLIANQKNAILPPGNKRIENQRKCHVTTWK